MSPLSEETPAAPDQASSPDPSPEPSDPPSSSPWQRLRAFVSPRGGRGHLLAALLALLLGFAVVTQVRQTRTSGLESLRQSDLIAVLGNVNNQSARLQRESGELTRTRDRLRTGGSGAAEAAARDRLNTVGILAGTVKATGPGITMIITDRIRAVSAPNLLDAVQELRDAGAEAIQINDVRVVANTWFATADGGRLVVDGKTLSPPYTVRAIGDPHTMGTAMAIPGGVTETLQQLGAGVTVKQAKQVDVTALRPLSQARYAQPDAGADQ